MCYFHPKNWWKWAYLTIFQIFSDGLKPLWCFVMSKSAVGWRVCPEYLSSKSATCLRFSINRIDWSTYYNLYLAVYHIHDVYRTHIYIYLNIYIYSMYIYIYTYYIHTCKYMIYLSILCVVYRFFFSHFYVKQAYLLLALPMLRISAGSFHPPFSDLAVTAGTVGTRRFGAQPRWNRRDFSRILRMCGWLTPETNRDTGIHRWCYIIFTCRYTEIYISLNIVIWYILICHYGGPTKNRWQDFQHLLAWMFLGSKRWSQYAESIDWEKAAVTAGCAIGCTNS